MFIFEEHSKQKNLDEKLLSSLLSDEFKEECLSSEEPRYLGLNRELNAFYYVGMRWVEWLENDKKQKGVIWVKPKNANIPFEKLLWKCLNHPKVCNYLSNCYEVYPDETAIQIPTDSDDFITPLLIVDFLVRVQRIVKKGLKKGFVRVRNR